MSLSLFNKLVNIIDNQELTNNEVKQQEITYSQPNEDKPVDIIDKQESTNDETTSETTDSQQHNETEPIVTGGVLMEDTIDNLVGGNQQIKQQNINTQEVITKELNDNLFEGGNIKNDTYSSFLHRLTTNEIFRHDNLNETVSFIHGGDKQTTKTNDEIKQSETNDNYIDVLPMFPYLVRYN